jgi:hypothetical protein
MQRIGYLCATQTFHEETDVLMLTTNMIKKVEVINCGIEFLLLKVEG